MDIRTSFWRLFQLLTTSTRFTRGPRGRAAVAWKGRRAADCRGRTGSQGARSYPGKIYSFAFTPNLGVSFTSFFEVLPWPGFTGSGHEPQGFGFGNTPSQGLVRPAGAPWWRRAVRVSALPPRE